MNVYYVELLAILHATSYILENKSVIRAAIKFSDSLNAVEKIKLL